MDVICIQDFGNHRVGDVIEIPDDSEFSSVYFAEKPKGKGAKSKMPATVNQANASDEATGRNTDESSTPVENPPADDDTAAATDNDSNSEE